MQLNNFQGPLHRVGKWVIKKYEIDIKKMNITQTARPLKRKSRNDNEVG